MYTIDKSVFSAEELEQYEALIAKALVDPEAAQEKTEEVVPPVVPEKKPEEKEEVEEAMAETKKSAPAVQATSAALEAVQKELAEFKKSVELQKFTELAKKYAPLGKKEDELGQTLYNLKKSDETSYNAFVGVLDEHLDLVEKSGVFAEIGKSGHGGNAVGGAEAKAEAKAREIMKSNHDMEFEEALAKAWEENPELMDEYDTEYFGH